MNNVMNEDSIKFLLTVEYLSKEEYLRAMARLRKSWKKNYSKISTGIRALKSQINYIGEDSISWRESQVFWCDVNELTDAEINQYNDEIKYFVNMTGELQSIKASFSKQATEMLEEYAFQRKYLKRCAHYSWTLDRMLEETNRRFC